MAHYNASLSSSIRSKSSSRSSDEIFYESQGIEAAHIVELLQKEIVYLTGGRDKEGGPILTLPMHDGPVSFTQNDIYDCVQYLSHIPSDESRHQGFTVIVDNRCDTWPDLRYLLAILKESLQGNLKRILVVKTSLEDRPKRLSVDLADKLQYVTLKYLPTYISPYQLTPNLGGLLPFKHSHWLQNRMNFEKFMKEAKTSSQHLDNAEAQVNRAYAKEGAQSPFASMKRKHSWNKSVMAVPETVIVDGKALLRQLQNDGESSYEKEEDAITTLDNLETQKKVKRVIRFLEHKMEQLYEFQDVINKLTMVNQEIVELQTSIKQVVDWILGPGEKLLASMTDIGDSCESAEELRKRHEEMEIKCAETYGNYAELRHRTEEVLQENESFSENILAQRDYMDTVCRGFASRLERRKILLINSVRFHRFAEDLSSHLDELLELLCSEVKVEDAPAAEMELSNLNDKSKEIDTLANETLNDGQSLLDEMSRPMKNSSGLDITPDYSTQIKHINKSVEDLQERKLRCDELADVRRLKLQQILQLFTCERDADQAVQWILELCDVMVKSQTNMGQTKEDIEKLQEEHKNFESTASATYQYGKQLLEAALFLRRSLRYSLDDNNLVAEQLERAWKKFSQGTMERANRLTLLAMFISSSDKILDRINQVFTEVCDLIENKFRKGVEVQQKYQPICDILFQDCVETIEMGKALLDRLSLPVIVPDQNTKNILMDDNVASTAIMASLQKLERMIAELNDYWNEVTKSVNTTLKTAEVNPQPITTAPVPPFQAKLSSSSRLSDHHQHHHHYHLSHDSIFPENDTLLGRSSMNISQNNHVSMAGHPITANVQKIPASNQLDISPIRSSPYEQGMAGYKDDDLLQRLHDVSINPASSQHLDQRLF